MSLSFSVIVAFHVESSHPFAPVERRIMLFQLKEERSPYHINTIKPGQTPFTSGIPDQYQPRKIGDRDKKLSGNLS